MIIILIIFLLDVAAEKTEKALIAGIEHFDASKLKHTETQEKNPLPNLEGELRIQLQCYNKLISFLFFSNCSRKRPTTTHFWN